MSFSHFLLESNEVQHLAEELSPLEGVVCGFEEHAEVIWHVLVDSGKSVEEKQIAVGDCKSILNSIG